MATADTNVRDYVRQKYGEAAERAAQGQKGCGCGTGGDCAINPRFVGYPDPKAPRWKKVYR